jgi:hypothetical protein
MGTGENESIMLAALALARLLTNSAKVVLVDLSPSSSALTATSVDPAAPGLIEPRQPAGYHKLSGRAQVFEQFPYPFPVIPAQVMSCR